MTVGWVSAMIRSACFPDVFAFFKTRSGSGTSVASALGGGDVAGMSCVERSSSTVLDDRFRFAAFVLSSISLNASSTASASGSDSLVGLTSGVGLSIPQAWEKSPASSCRELAWEPQGFSVDVL